MKPTSPLMGYIVYMEKEYPFLFEDGILRLFPPTREDWRKRRRSLFQNLQELKAKCQAQEWVGHSRLKGQTHDGDSIVFSVSDLSSNDNGFESFSVDYHFKYNVSYLDDEQIYGFSLTGKDVDRFYNPRCVFTTDVSCDELGIQRTGVYVENKNDNGAVCAGSYRYGDTEITVSFRAVPTLHFRSEAPLSAHSRMIVSFSKPQNLEYLLQVYEHCCRFFYYVCYRRNIELDSPDIYGMRDGRKSNEGILWFPQNDLAGEVEQKDAEEMIVYDDLGEKMMALFPPLAEDQIYLEHLCPSVAERRSWGINHIILMFVAFEREFRNLYDDTIVRSDMYVEVRAEVMKFLENLKENSHGKKKKYIGEMERTLSKTENKYADRMEKALRDCEEILCPFLKYYYRDDQSDDLIEDICARMNQLRNDAAHGNIDLQIDPVHISDFAILESLIYAMRLKAIGVELEKIQTCLQTMKGTRMILA